MICIFSTLFQTTNDPVPTSATWKKKKAWKLSILISGFGTTRLFFLCEDKPNLFRSCQEERWLFDVLGHSEGCRTNIRNTEMESCRAKTLHRTSISWRQRQTGGTRLPFMPNIACVWMNLSGPHVTLMMSTPVAATCFANLFSAARALCNKNKQT